MRHLMTIFALFLFAGLASANPPQARSVECVPARVYAPPQVYQPAQVRYQLQEVVDPCPPAVVEYRQPARVLRLEQDYYVPQARQLNVYYSQPARLEVRYAQSARFAELGRGVAVVNRREGLFERLGNRQRDRRDSQALRRSGQSEALIIRR